MKELTSEALSGAALNETVITNNTLTEPAASVIDLRLCIIFTALSFAVLAFFFVLIIIRYKRAYEKQRIINGVVLFTIGVYIAVLLSFIPIFFSAFEFKDSSPIFRPFFVSLYSALRVFLVDYDYQDFIKATEGLVSPMHEIYGLYFSVLYVIAPVMTLTNVLSLFKNIWGELRLRFFCFGPIYVFSELNQQSVAMAKSIIDEYRDGSKKSADKGENEREPYSRRERRFKKLPIHNRPTIVFTDVVDPEGERDYELLQKAMSFHAIILKKDITHLKLNKRSWAVKVKGCFKPKWIQRRVEFFVMGDNDSECIEQAIRLTESNREYKNRFVFLFSAKPVAGYILDSIDKGDNLISEKLRASITENPMGFLNKCSEDTEAAENLRLTEAAVEAENAEDFDPDNPENADCFRLSRVNTVQQLSIDVLRDDKLFSAMYEKAYKTKEFSLLIVGLGLYGSAFLRTALWMYQLSGFTVKISIIEQSGKAVIRKLLENEIPALAGFRRREAEVTDEKTKDGKYKEDKNLLCYGHKEDGLISFEIVVHCAVNCNRSGFQELITDSRKRPMDSVQLAVVALGEDDKNIETSIKLRRCCDRIGADPMIYSVVYDGRKADNLNFDKQFDINFVGAISKQYDYSTIRNLRIAEQEGLNHHFDWIRSTYILREAYKDACKNANSDYISLMHSIDAESSRDPEKAERLSKQGLRTDDEVKERVMNIEWGDEDKYVDDALEILDSGKLIDEVQSYARSEYFRDSSMAKGYHNKLMDKHCKGYFRAVVHSANGLCVCEQCTVRRRTEHMRWCAYMYTRGHIYADQRNKRALLHNDLKNWDDLKTIERNKD